MRDVVCVCACECVRLSWGRGALDEDDEEEKKAWALVARRHNKNKSEVTEPGLKKLKGFGPVGDLQGFEAAPVSPNAFLQRFWVVPSDNNRHCCRS